MTRDIIGSVGRPRNSVKATIEQLATELLRKPWSPMNEAKLDLIQSIALTMNWAKLHDLCKNRSSSDRKKPWWVE